MNKKLLLIALPALMVMSSCTYLQSATVQPKDEFFKEDTVLNEELFGKLEPRQLGVPDVDPGADPSWTKAPKVGVQFRKYEKVADSGDWYFAVRYVAAIADTEGMIATWSRAVSEKNSNQIKGMVHDKVSSVKYASLNNGGSPKAATSEGTGYDKYVVYSMYDIPEAQEESYIAAYLTLSKSEQEDVVSKVVVTQIDGSYNFSFDKNDLVKDGYFLQTTSGIVKQKADADTDPSTDAKDNAFFENIPVNDEEFGLFRFTDSCFQFFGYDKFFNSNEDGDGVDQHSSQAFVKAADLDQFGEIYLPGTYNFYVNKYNFVYTEPVSVTTTLYFQPNENWKADGARFAAYVYHKDHPEDETATAIQWLDLSETVADSGIFKADIDITSHNYIIFCRMNPSEAENDWANKWNQTGNLGMPTDYSWLVGHKKYTLNASDPADVDWNAYGGEWLALA